MDGSGLKGMNYYNKTFIICINVILYTNKSCMNAHVYIAINLGQEIISTAKSINIYQ